MKEILIRIGQMSCQHCVNAVEKALKSLPGVDEVNVDLEREQARVMYDEVIFDLQQAEKAIEEEGYEYRGVIE